MIMVIVLSIIIIIALVIVGVSIPSKLNLVLNILRVIICVAAIALIIVALLTNWERKSDQSSVTSTLEADSTVTTLPESGGRKARVEVSEHDPSGAAGSAARIPSSQDRQERATGKARSGGDGRAKRSSVRAGSEEFNYTICLDKRGRYVYTNNKASCSEELIMFGYMCDLVDNLPHCNPPERMAYTPSPSPYNIEVVFAGEYKKQNYTYWQWKKPGESEVFFVTPRFFLRSQFE